MDGLVYDWDVAGGVSRRTCGIADFLGWRLEEVPTDSDWWPKQIHPEDVGEVVNHFKEAVARKAGGCRHEYRIRHKDGHYIWVWDSNRIAYGRDGAAVRVVGCVVSIDKRKQVEQEVRRAKEQLSLVNEDLEQKVAERTTRLADMVAEMESWSYSIAHDLRAPLRSMRGFSTYMLEEYHERLDATGQEYLKRIDGAAGRLDAYLKDLFHYGKLGSGECPLGPVNTASLIDEILATYPNLQPPHCVIEVKPPLPPVHGNESALVQVFSNLLGNAVKFVKKGTEPKVQVWAEPRDGWVRVWFQDNGIGIEESAQKHVFDMFHRLNPSSEYDGTGMGLAIVRRAMTRMGGRVGLESQPERGSRFWVELKRG
jgi:PAS domain S-box-containing protein